MAHSLPPRFISCSTASGRSGAVWSPMYRLRITIMGVLTHLWLPSMAQEILGSSYVLLFMAPETESKATLKKFFVTAGCLHPDLTPNENLMWFMIPFDSQQPQPGFPYKVVIIILDVQVVDPSVRPPPGYTGFSLTDGVAVGPHQLLATSGGASSIQPACGRAPLLSGKMCYFRGEGGHWASTSAFFGTPVDSVPLSRPCSYPEWGL